MLLRPDMVRGNICEQAVIKHDPADSVQHQCLGGNLHHAALRSRIGGREFLILDDSSVRSDKPGLLSGGLQDRLDHVARRGLSLCPGDPDRDQLLRRIAESRRGEFRQCKSSVFYPDHRHICRDFHFFFYHEDLAARL